MKSPADERTETAGSDANSIPQHSLATEDSVMDLVARTAALLGHHDAVNRSASDRVPALDPFSSVPHASATQDLEPYLPSSGNKLGQDDAKDEPLLIAQEELPAADSGGVDRIDPTKALLNTPAASTPRSSDTGTHKQKPQKQQQRANLSLKDLARDDMAERHRARALKKQHEALLAASDGGRV